MNIDLILNIVKNVIDICLVWFGLYYILKNIRNNVKMTLLFKGLLKFLQTGLIYLLLVCYWNI